ncbi:MAG: hypothetical protein JWM33_2880 [Caulobacteraceae bacterium]|nr:hypothetical protein [Caulobacteraceae bacterium]
MRPPASIQAAPSSALKTVAAPRPPSAQGLKLDALASRHLGELGGGEDQDLAVVADDGDLVSRERQDDGDRLTLEAKHVVRALLDVTTSV